MRHDPSAAATKLKWKPSRFGGRAIAWPSVTASALAVSRQKPKLHNSVHDHVTDIRVMGEVGREDAEVLRSGDAQKQRLHGVPALGLRQNGCFFHKMLNAEIHAHVTMDNMLCHATKNARQECCMTLSSKSSKGSPDNMYVAHQ